MFRQTLNSKLPATGKLFSFVGVVYAQVTLPGYSGTGFKFAGATVGDVMSEALKYAYPLAGVGLFAMMIWGGLEIMLSGGAENKLKSGQARLTNAVLGFVIVFLSYLIAQIVEVILHIKIV